MKAFNMQGPAIEFLLAVAQEIAANDGSTVAVIAPFALDGQEVNVVFDLQVVDVQASPRAEELN